ncbi:protocadherin Fat 4-like isoform X2 [Ornithorhynchus anatinus]|uniref:protocadherin Fat 4-like isoform X2 n=1 Tax=Ornithorhynchus anatinus TaxID=9258 RepID=UPI0010A8BD50|nr:protocadherin Fat 4-like isoform X2 [Ornithorhynchus anatinus]
MASLNSLLITLLLLVSINFLDAQEITTVDCNKSDSNTLELPELEEEYTGDIELITNIPQNVTLKLEFSLYPEHAEYLELLHSPGSSIATVRTTKPLDLEAINGPLLYSVTCQRNGNNVVYINKRKLSLLDINDNSPVFLNSSYSISILETFPLHNTVIRVEATDKDYSLDYHLIQYSLLGQNAEYFSIKEGDGVITLKKFLDFNKIQQYNLTVKAQERFGNNSGTATLLIAVQDYDTMNPYFIHSIYKANILENQMGKLTLSPEEIKAIDGDIGINEKVYYEVKRVDPAVYSSNLSINANSGALFLKNALDREVISHITVEIKATQQDNELKTANAMVLVSIQDENDNLPEFERSSYMVSIPENSPDGTTVFHIKVTDKDEGGFNGTLHILPEDSAFQINDAGMISVKNSSVLDRERIGKYTLQVKATDHLPPHSEAQAVITISLLDENDNSPVFKGTPYEQTIFSNRTVGMTIVQIVSHDEDDGKNGIISLTLTGGNEKGYFELNVTSGIITLKKDIILEANRFEQFTLWITATDAGDVPRSSSVPVHILVTGESKPYFVHRSYNGFVEEEKSSPVIVVQVEFVSLNPIIPVSLQVLTESDTFAIDSNGTIWTKTRLDYELQQSYILNVSLTQRDVIDYSTVLVNVTDINDNPPSFNMLNRTIHVLESQRVEITLLNASAIDADSGYNGLVSYSLKGGESKIDIDSVTGFITLRKDLDREMQALYNLTITASDQGQPPLTTELNITVIVEDVNDNKPIFEMSKYNVTVHENAAIGTVLLATTATDLDVGANAEVKYAIASVDPSSASPMFSINTTTGQLSLSQPLDFETIKWFKIEVKASDGGNPSLHSLTSVFIQVLDVNDNPPEFSQSIYNIFALENSQSNSVIFRLKVTDKDEAGFSQGHFVLNSTVFDVDKNGVLSLMNGVELDRETVPGFILQVWAVDAEIDGLSSSAWLNITVLDVNDNNPEFQEQPFSFTIPEGRYGADVSTVVGKVAATDLDDGDNALISFHLCSETEENVFSIKQSGNILVVNSLDREVQDTYKLLLVASDRGTPQRQNYTYVTIGILDVNDNPPQFTKSEYSAKIRVTTAQEGDFVLSVLATDLDLGNNSLISYSFSTPSEDFVIDEQTGRITLSRNLIHVMADTVIALTVVATDHGVSPLTSNASVALYLLVNDTDFKLTFERSSYDFSLEEEGPINALVGSVKALTGSIAVTVTYALSSYLDNFSIDDQGNIVTVARLDREEQDLYSFVAEAVDSSTPPNTAVTMITVTIRDINDNPPVFSSLIPTTLSCPEGQNSTDFGIFSATDRDIGDNARITYFLEDDFGGTFQINNSTGRLITGKTLDRETKDNYTLKILATDMGKMQLSATLNLSLTVEDVNDNPPTFPQESFRITVKENEPPQTILNVTATDKDIGYNAAIHYSIVETTSLFFIGELSGKIGTLQPLDYETSAQYTFTVRAFNPGDLQLQDTAQVIVSVEDVNEEGPQFDKPSYYRFLLDNSTVNTLVVDLDATDENQRPDEGIYYNITDGNFEGLYKITSSTGQITLTRDLTKLNTTVMNSLTVSAMDSGQPPLSTSVKVSVLIAPTNTSIPVFPAEVFQPDPLSEKVLPGAIVTQVIALYKGPVIYSISYGNEKDYFKISEYTGIISTKKNITVEDFPIEFQVRAADTKDLNIYNEMAVQVLVVDENDFPPTFPKSLFVESLEENTAPTEIIHLKAQDNDSGSNGLLTYGILSGDRQKFKINATTGMLSSIVSFDYEEGHNEYQIVVSAEDDGIPEKKMGYCTVILNILDKNDHAPEFESVDTFTVKENSPNGTAVGRVIALDRDSGDNAFILYAILDGGENMFYIDVILGNIKVKNPPDYEKQNQYILTVSATNNKSAPFYQTNKTVTINIVDLNDNPPRFTQDDYSATVNMVNPVASSVITVKAIDGDQGDNAAVEYSILPDVTISQNFLIDNPNEGRILVIGNLSVSGEILLTVMAKDRGSPPLNETAVITLNVIDNRPFVPQFDQNEMSTNVKENTGVGYLVHTFVVAGTSGKQIDYKIVAGNELGHFNLDGKSGQLKTTVNLDYEETPKYSIVVEATERIFLTSEDQQSGLFDKNVAQLKVCVEDVNEAPSFLNKYYSARVPSSVFYRFPVIQVQATDPDLGINGSLRYKLDDHTATFDIDENSGQIFVVSARSKKGTLSLTAEATDQQGRGLTARTNVELTIEPSSEDNIVVLFLNQKINVVEKNILPTKSSQRKKSQEQ